MIPSMSYTPITNHSAHVKTVNHTDSLLTKEVLKRNQVPYIILKFHHFWTPAFSFIKLKHYYVLVMAVTYP